MHPSGEKAHRNVWKGVSHSILDADWMHPLCITVKNDQARFFLLAIEPVSNNLKLPTGATLNTRLLASCGVPQDF